jgi:poly(3-hydroxybutyrate) depolymerase
MAEALTPLRSYDVAPGGNSLSGLSSGGSMAVQMHLAHASCFIGAGVIAGGPYRCAESFRGAAILAEDANDLNALYICMSPLTARAGPDPEQSLRLARETAADGRIDPLEHLGGQRVYIFSGTKDTVVLSSVVVATHAFYKSLYAHLGVDPAPKKMIEFVNDEPAGHAILTDNDWDQDIGESRPPYINNSVNGKRSAYMQSHQILDHIYRDRGCHMPAESLSAKIISFDQREFLADYENRAGMGDLGFVYVPAAVAAGQRARGVHICLHGCKQSYGFVDYVNGRKDRADRAPHGRRYVVSTGYNYWAEANDLIVLYPQVEARDDNVIQNPDGCWDWWGYARSQTDGSHADEPPDFYSKDAPQIRVLHAMLQRLCGAAAGDS